MTLHASLMAGVPLVVRAQARAPPRSSVAAQQRAHGAHEPSQCTHVSARCLSASQPSARHDLHAVAAPPPPAPPWLQDKFARMIDHTQRSGKTLNDSLRSKQDYRNPDFLNKLVEQQGIQQYGTCFEPEVFSPDALPAEDRPGACVGACMHALLCVFARTLLPPHA